MFHDRERTEEDMEECRRMKRLVKSMVREAKQRVKEEWKYNFEF